MMRYFFDIAAPDRVFYDFQGREFCSIEDAGQMAELVALDFESSEDFNASGTEVQIRDVSGNRILSIAIDAPAKRAA
jgi:hypothetical protein